ncbi:hypothetical protein MPTK1_7g18480 [Marchantia polymorpha subsp. ruderalis]|uniref:Uncharacterized protein n=2 Tax=Marchantia polymorpha TaxID=3197 RepID=A0AAF6C144_MARPO|nr:hypothetical protein MARPO_0165s0008 [Marchantia polymorpha]BBN17978.1 hypothetical protein Mp_7g18480 [Marchantia polymorpha subsp. ruderalis]|eukprot:PTQ28378.1 hypothetical protein MARPO_0165s0008 [Marchantia polymorpha]
MHDDERGGEQCSQDALLPHRREIFCRRVRESFSPWPRWNEKRERRAFVCPTVALELRAAAAVPSVTMVEDVQSTSTVVEDMISDLPAALESGAPSFRRARQ